MAFFFRKQRHIEHLFERYVGCVERANEIFPAAMHMFLEHGLGPGFDESVRRADQAESDADHVLSEIERALYVNELLPDARGDLKTMLDTLDRVPNQVETTLFRIALCRMELPEALHPEVLELVSLTGDTVGRLCELVRTLFRAPGDVGPVVVDIHDLEGQTDEVTHALTERIYSMEELSLAEKMFHDDLIEQVSKIADRAEDAADQIDIIAVKRVL